MAEPILLGIVGIKNMGVYDADTNYEKLNGVTYQGSTYCAIQNSKGKLPTNPDYWQLYAEKGDVGPQGPQGPKPVKGVDYYTNSDKQEIENDLVPAISDEVSSQLSTLTSATPLGASSMSDMTDTSRIYVLETDGHWYWYDGTNWQDGGVYQSYVESDDIKLINDKIDSIEKDNVFKYLDSWQIGNVNLTDGSIMSKSNYHYMTTTDKKPILSDNLFLDIASGLEYRGALFKPDGTFHASINNWTTINNPSLFQNKKGYFYRIAIKKINGDEFNSNDYPSNEYVRQCYYNYLGTSEIATKELLNKLEQSKVNANYSIIPIEYTKESGLVGSNGGTYSGSNYYHITQEIEENKFYSIVCRGYDSDFNAYFIKDQYNNVIKTFGVSGQTYQTIIYTPKGSHTITLNGNSTVDIEEVQYNTVSVGLLANKNGLALGDSILQGMGVLINNAAPSKDCISVLNALGGSNIINGGIGGSRLSNGDCSLVEIVSSIVNNDWTNFDAHLQTLITQQGNKFNYLTNRWSQIKALDFSKLDYLLLAYGTNDWTSGKVLGTSGSTDTNTILGALNYCVSNLLTLYPNLKIYFFTPCFRYNIYGQEGTDSDTYTQGTSGLKLFEIGDAIDSECKKLHIPCKNMYYESNLNTYTKTLYMSDGTHRNEAGYRLLGEQYLKYISSN